MAEKLIGSLLYDDHPTPKKARPLKDRIKVPGSIALILFVLGGTAYKFANYREESQVSQFLETIRNGQYEDAYAMWDAGERYRMRDFLEDWGDDGFYTKGATEFGIYDSDGGGGAVTVYAEIAYAQTAGEVAVVAILVHKETLLLSFSPDNKYAGRR